MISNEKKDKRFRCEICNGGFATPGGLRVHMNSAHNKDKPFRCNLCDFYCKERKDLSIHIKSVHKGKVIYIRRTIMVQAGKSVLVSDCSVTFFFLLITEL